MTGMLVLALGGRQMAGMIAFNGREVESKLTYCSPETFCPS